MFCEPGQGTHISESLDFRGSIAAGALLCLIQMNGEEGFGSSVS